VAFLGGREFQLAGGTWDRAGERIQALAAHLESALRCPIHLGVCQDPVAAEALGQQAMREGHPWRGALALPPALPCFTPGLAGDCREVLPLESRAAFPHPLARLLTTPPEALLRVPAVPMEGAMAGFLGTLQPPPAIRWLPPELPPPGPFHPDRPWAPARACPPLADTSQVRQPSLFEGLE
jgi:hypothetical protein